VNRKRVALVVSAAVIGGLVLVGCNDKNTEPFRDAHVSHRNDNSAEVGTMPDGFANWADKCDGHGHRVFTVYHGDNHYGDIAVVNDSTC